MKCPKCMEEIPGIECQECRQCSPEGAKFCMYCGAQFHQEALKTTDEEDAFDIENRILCPDGTCTGIIVDGKCTECGRPYERVEKEQDACMN